MKILAITAHPDDFETGMGGLATRLVHEGHSVTSIVATAGKDAEETDRRIQESKNAHALLNIAPSFFPFFVQQLTVDDFPRDIFRYALEDADPDVVFTMWGMDIHPDHRAVSLLTIEPCLQKGVNVELFAMEVCSRPGVPQTLGFAPTHYADITEEPAVIKEQMLGRHKSQNFESIRSAHDELERNRGAECGVERAEAFVRLTRYGTLAEWLQPFFIPSPFKLPRMMGIDAVL